MNINEMLLQLYGLDIAMALALGMALAKFSVSTWYPDTIDAVLEFSQNEFHSIQQIRWFTLKSRNGMVTRVLTSLQQIHYQR